MSNQADELIEKCITEIKLLSTFEEPYIGLSDYAKQSIRILENLKSEKIKDWLRMISNRVDWKIREDLGKMIIGR